MSNLRNGTDDFPDAAAKLLDDARALFANGRYDGSGYFSGYVVECSLKALVMVEALCAAATLGRAYSDARDYRHDITRLSAEATRLAALGTASTAKYVGLLSNPSQLSGVWGPALRYSGPGRIGRQDAEDWLGEANATYTSTVGEMRLDGVIY